MIMSGEDYLGGNVEWWGLEQTRNHITHLLGFALPQGRTHLVWLDLRQEKGGNLDFFTGEINRFLNVGGLVKIL